MPVMRAKHRGGWTDWVFPQPKPGKNYVMICCDCGLEHEMQFSPFIEHTRRRDTFQIVKLPWPVRVMFRARRARK